MQLQQSQNMAVITKAELLHRIEQLKSLVRKSFFPPSSVPAKSISMASPSSSLQKQFDFDCYSHFRVYNEILVKQKVFFPYFQREFESTIGKRLLLLALQRRTLLLPPSKPPSSEALKESVHNALRVTEALATFLQTEGFIHSWERSILSNDDINDWSLQASGTIPSGNYYITADLQYTLALNGDVTLKSQLLLQELGYRMYPSFGRWLVKEGMLECFTNNSHRGGDVSVNIDDYYMDTEYNSNPDLYDVKQVLLNIVIQCD